MNELLLLIGLLFPCWYGYRRSVSAGRVEINHVTTFTFGFLFYWMTPLAVRIWISRVDFPMASVWIDLFRPQLIEPYALSCVVLYFCFAAGDALAIRILRGSSATAGPKIPRPALSLVTLAGFLLMLYSAYFERAYLFRPAAPGTMRVGVARGAVTSCMVLLATVALMFTIEHPEVSWRKRLLSPYFLAPMTGASVMILLGSRLYVASILLMFAIYQTNLRRRFKLKTVIAAALVFALIFGAIGTWREGSSATGAYFNVFLEPMLGSLSLVHHLRYKGIAWINEPTQLISDFKNLIPTVLMPDKFKALKKPDAYRPLGGLHSFVSFNLNFGIVGTAIVLFLLPIGFRYLKSRFPRTLPATFYIMCTAWLGFTFFRDAFSISIVKAMFEDSILIPTAIVGFGSLLRAACVPSTDTGDVAGNLQAEML